MRDSRTTDWRSWAQQWLSLSVWAGLAVGVGVYLGRWMMSPNWESALRLAIMGGMTFAIMINQADGFAVWLMVAPFGQTLYSEIWRILNIRLPAGVPDLTPDRLAAVLLGLIFVANLAIGKRKLQRLGTEVYMALFCVMIVPAIWTGLNGLTSTAQSVLDKFMIPFLVFVLAKNLFDPRGEHGLRRLATTLAVVETYLCYAILYEHIRGVPILSGGHTTVYSKSLPKIVSILGNPAFLGTVLAMISTVMLYMAMHDSSKSGRAFYAVMFALAVSGNFFCYNRGAWLALAVGFVVLLLEQRYRQLLLPAMMVAAAVALIYWEAVSASAVITERLSNPTSIRFRLNLLETSREMILDHLAFGVGVGNFSYYYLDYGGTWEDLAYDLPMPHNTYILVLATMGLAGFVPYLLIFLSTAWSLLRSYWRRRSGDAGRALAVTGLAAVVMYMVSAAAVDLYVNVYTSFVLFFISGSIIGYFSHLGDGVTAPRAESSVRPAAGP